MQGIVYRLHAKPQTPGEKGIPKISQSELHVTKHGAEGDYNIYRIEKKNGDARMALLLLPLETIAQLEGEGWPVDTGHLGENITTKGIPYEHFALGQRYRIGKIEIEIAKVCNPCITLYSLPYVGEKKGPEFIKALLGRRGWYAKVIKEGTIQRRDRIEQTS